MQLWRSTHHAGIHQHRRLDQTVLQSDLSAIFHHFGDVLKHAYGGAEAVLVGILTLVVVDEEHNPRLRTILQPAVHRQTTWDIITHLDVNWNSVTVQSILTDSIALVICLEPLLPLNSDNFSLRL